MHFCALLYGDVAGQLGIYHYCYPARSFLIAKRLPFLPSPVCESSVFSYSSLPLATMDFADFSLSIPWLRRPPLVRALSFGQFLLHLLNKVVGCKHWYHVLPYPLYKASYAISIRQYSRFRTTKVLSKPKLFLYRDSPASFTAWVTPNQLAAY